MNKRENILPTSFKMPLVFLFIGKIFDQYHFKCY